MPPEANRAEPHWPEETIVRMARRWLASGGMKARREIVRTTLALDRLLSS
jgi:hypothetical protein